MILATMVLTDLVDVSIGMGNIECGTYSFGASEIDWPTYMMLSVSRPHAFDVHSVGDQQTCELQGYRYWVSQPDFDVRKRARYSVAHVSS